RIPEPALRRHGAACRHRTRARVEAAPLAAGRAVRRGRRVHAAQAAAGVQGAAEARPADGALRHARRARGDRPRRCHRRDVAAPRGGQDDHPRAPRGARPREPLLCTQARRDARMPRRHQRHGRRMTATSRTPSSGHVVGVDIGTQSTKAVLVDARGRVVAQAAHGYQVDSPQPLWAEQWPSVWLDAVVACVRGVVDRSGVAASAIDALCVSSLYGGSGIPVDGDGKALHPCLIWMDRRARDEVDWVRSHADLERLYDVTGNGVDSYYGYTKMLWLRDKQPDVWKRTRQLLPPNSFVIAELTGEVAVDHSSAGNIGGIYDIGARRWSGEMLDMLGIPRHLMPERLVQSSDVVGRLREPQARALGLRAGLPVVAGGVDAAVATLAAGARKPGNHVAMIGTSMCWGTIRPRVDARHGLIAMPHVLNGLTDLYVFGGAITAGACVTWFRDNFCEGELAAATARGVDPHELLEAPAEALAPGAQGLVFLPYLMGERSPIWDAAASGAFVGLGLHHGRAHL